jgi:hypothetical protein
MSRVIARSDRRARDEAQGFPSCSGWNRPIPPAMTEISGASALSMSSLYALMGQAMPPGASTASADGAASNPALAMMAAANASAGMQVMALLGSMAGGGPAVSAGTDAAVLRAASLSQALAGLSYLDPAKELALLGSDLPATSAEAASS